tara:strand:- start:9 stop:341 length:333 start_codon:yes stop_codon:yes gene_type:complete
MFLDNKEINMYIPWVHIKTDKEYIEELIEELDWGSVKNISMIKIQSCRLKNGKINPNHYKVYINIDNLTHEGIEAYNKMEKYEEYVEHFYGKWPLRRCNINYRKPNFQLI